MTAPTAAEFITIVVSWSIISALLPDQQLVVMDWLKNNHPAVITAAIFGLGFVIFLYASSSQFISYDAYWHLKMGQDLLSNGLSPEIDHYSFTFPNQPISSIPYLFQIILSIFVSIFGSPEGFQLLKMFSINIFMVAIYFYYKEIKAPWQIIFITLPYIFLFLLFRFNHIRAEIFDNALVIVALILYLRASKSFTHKNLAYIAVLQLFWVNYHVAILGYVIFFGLFLDKAIEIITRKDTAISWQRWTSWGLVIFVVGFANPEFNHPLFSVFNFSADWGFIVEYTPTNQISPNNPFFYAFWLVSGYIVISLILQRQYGLALVACIFAFQSWETIHVITISGIVVTCLLALSLAQVNFGEVFKAIKPTIRALVIVLGAAVAVSGILQSASKASLVNKIDNSSDLPDDIAQYLKKNYPQGGNIFNQMRHGGFLLYHLSPEFKVYIDGRTNILYPIDFTKRYADLYGPGQLTSITEEIDRYNIEFAIYPLETAWFPLTDRSNSMSAEFVGKNFILMSTRKNNFPLSSHAMFIPMCWQQPNQQELALEFARAQKILPRDSALLAPLETLLELHSNVSKEEVFSSNNSRNASSRYHKRLLGFAALELNSYEHAFEFFRSIQENNSLDSLMLAYAALNSQNYRATEEILLVTLSSAWAKLTKRNLSGTEQAIAVTLLENLNKHQALSSHLADQLDYMKKTLQVNFPSLELPLANVIPNSRCEATFSTITTAAN